MIKLIHFVSFSNKGTGLFLYFIKEKVKDHVIYIKILFSQKENLLEKKRGKRQGIFGVRKGLVVF